MYGDYDGAIKCTPEADVAQSCNARGAIDGGILKIGLKGARAGSILPRPADEIQRR